MLNNVLGSCSSEEISGSGSELGMSNAGVGIDRLVT